MDLLTKLDQLDQELENLENNSELIQNHRPIIKEINSIVSEEDENKISLAKDRILSYVLELLDTPLSPKDLKDLTDIIQKLEGKQDNSQNINIVIQNIMQQFQDDV